MVNILNLFMALAALAMVKVSGRMFEVFFLLAAGHALCDYPLQGDFLAKAKNRFLMEQIEGHEDGWWKAMLAHCLIQALGVFLVTGSLAIALFEFILHWTIDYNKCAGRISSNMDQALHYFCKLIWAVAFIWSNPL